MTSDGDFSRCGNTEPHSMHTWRDGRRELHWWCEGVPIGRRDQSREDLKSLRKIMERNKAGGMMLTDEERAVATERECLHNPGFHEWADSLKEPAQAELPVEHELVDKAWYMVRSGNGVVFEGETIKRMTGWAMQQGWRRLALVARYEPKPQKPEVQEPTGLGAVVREHGAGGVTYVNIGDGIWHNAKGGYEGVWVIVRQPVEVLSNGVEL